MTAADGTGTGAGTGTGTGTARLDSEEALREDIARTREQLGDTVEALVAKADIKARAQQKATGVVTRVRQQTEQLRSRMPAQLNARAPAAGLALTVGLALVTTWLLVRRVRRARRRS